MSIFARAYRQLSALDLDEIFSYQTTKEVRMIDFRLGAVCNLIRLVVLCYVIIYVFIYKKGYSVPETSVGHVIVDVSGSTYSLNDGKAQPWDSVDVVYPALEDGAVFVGTQIAVTKEQTIKQGSDTTLVCSPDTADKDCPVNPAAKEGAKGICVGGYCQTYAWHPTYDPNVKTTVVNQLVDVDKFTIWLRSSIQFPSLDSARFFSTMDAATPTPYNGSHAKKTASNAHSATIGEGGNGAASPPDLYTLGEILELAGTTYETVRKTGATIAATFIWDCFVDSAQACVPRIQFQRMDLNEKRRGFDYTYAHYYRPTAAAANTRDQYTVQGVRILVSSLGEGRKVSVSAIMLQISSAIALLWLASYAADFLMLYVLPEKKHYRTYKQEKTPDFSDLRNKIAEVEGERKKLRDRKNRFAAKLDEA